MPLTTVTACKAFRNIEADNHEHDEELARLIPAVQAFLEEECERTFDQDTLTEYFDGDLWRDRVLLARPPILSITNVWDDPARAYTTPMSVSAYDVQDAQAGLVRLLDDRTFSTGQRNIKVTYLGGYAVVPADLEQAAIEMVWAAREKGASNLVGVRSRSVADGSVTFLNLDWGSSNLAPVIAKYRLHTGLG